MKQATLCLIEELKEKKEDFEWYPTTDEILTVVAKNIAGKIDRYRLSILDIGAGNGSALNTADIYQRSCFSVAKKIHPNAKTVSIMNHRWTIVFHIEGQYVMIDRIIPSKMMM